MVNRLAGIASIWAGRHAQSAVSTLGRIAHQPLGSLLTISVIGVALALPAMLYVASVNGRTLAGNWQSVRDFSVYLSPGTPVSKAETLADELRGRDIIASVEVITASAALEELGRTTGFDGALDDITDNPLPHTLLVRPLDVATPDDLALVARQVAADEDVDQVQVDTQWIARLDAILEYARRAVLAGSVMLALAIVVVIGNTIRLDIQNRRDEIEVQKLLGASDAFVRRPFLYTGLWFGVLGGLFALLLALSLGLATGGAAGEIANLYETDFNLLRFDAGVGIGMVAAGSLSGWLGAWWAVARHLGAIQPS